MSPSPPSAGELARVSVVSCSAASLVRATTLFDDHTNIVQLLSGHEQFALESSFHTASKRMVLFRTMES